LLTRKYCEQTSSVLKPTPADGPGDEPGPALARGWRPACRQLVAMLALTVALTSCVSPAINADGYRGKVGHSAQKMAGIIGSAQLAAQLDLEGKLLDRFADQTISDAEQDAQSVLTSLDSVQPPDQTSITLRSQADQVLQDAASELSDLRIAQRRGDTAGMRQTLAELTTTLGKVQQLQENS
jgi:hypothetical protein